MKTYLEYKDEKSHKFWEIEVIGNSHTVRYGNIEAKGKTSSIGFETEKEAQEDAERLIASKKEIGYKETKKPKENPNKYKVDLQRFEQKLKDWGFGYPEFAGCKRLYDAKVRGNVLYPEQDCVMYDERCNEGTYGISHEVHTEILKVRLNRPKNFDIDYKIKPKKRAVTTYELLCRYMWMSDLFTDWEFRKTVNPINYNNWDNVEDIYKSFSDEINELENDPYLALYWLLHTGFTCDEQRYEQVKNKILEFNLAEQLTDIYDALVWFEKHDVFYNMPVKYVNMFSKTKHEPDADDLFLIRRAYLLFTTYTYEYAKDENTFEKWWLSVKLYPKAEENMIKRMRWLRNNLNKYNKWNLFEEKIKTDTTEIALLSYVLAQNPNEENKTKFADKFIQELAKGKDFWKDETPKLFAQTMIYDLKDSYSDIETLKDVLRFYFAGNTRDAKLKELEKQHFEDSLTVDIEKEIEELQNILNEGIEDSLMYIEEEEDLTPKILKTFKNTKKYLSGLNDDKITAIVNNIITDTNKYESLIYVLIEYLFESKVKNREVLLILLIDNCDDSAEFLLRNFLKTLIKDDNDPNYEVVRKVYGKSNTKSFGDLSSSLPFAFINIVHQKTIFNNWFINVFDHIPNEKAIKITDYIFNRVDYYGRMKQVNAIARFDKSQLEQMCDKIISALYRLKDDKHDFHTVISYLYEIAENKLLKDWFENFMKDFKNFKQSFSDEFKRERIKDIFRSVCNKLKITDEELLKNLEC